MERRRPLFAVSLLALVTSACLLQWSVAHDLLPYLCVVLACLGFAGLVRGLPAAPRTAAALMLGCLVVLRLDWAAPVDTASSMRGRMEGIVTASRPTALGGWMAVTGEMDLQQTPACECTAIVRVRSPELLAGERSSVVVRGTWQPY